VGAGGEQALGVRTLYLEPFGGLAGDMFLAGLLDLRQPELTLDGLREFVGAILGDACRLEETEVARGALRGRHLEVRTDESDEPPHRHLADLVALVAGAPLGERARVRAVAVLERIARAEARVHGTSVDAVHFHEIGAVDTIVDVCGAVWALERLGIEEFLSAPPYAGGGSVDTAHGEMPVPAPGTLGVLGELPWIAGIGGERLTPTGAALYAELARTGSPGHAETIAHGYGAGTREPREGPPNLLRVQLLDARDVGSAGGGVPRREAWLLECNLDDTTGEEVGFLLEELRRAGALEAWSAPLHMKKDRPGTLVSALCRRASREALERVAFTHSPTLGVRWSPRERAECERRSLQVTLDAGGDERDPVGVPVRVRVRLRPDGGPVLAEDVSPEFDDLAALARERGVPLRRLEAQARELALRALERERS